MKLLGIIILSLFSLSAFSQKLVQAEYFIDIDPGFGIATQITLPNDSLVDINMNVDISALPSGLHTFMLRAKNDSGLWGTVCSRNFMVVTSSQLQPKDISRIEYFMDTDPGYGNATPISFTPDTIEDLSVALDLSAVAGGAHILVIRAQDSAGVWSQSYAQMFTKATLGAQLMITEVEYFIDTDPGYGNGTQLSFTQDSLLNDSVNVSLASLGGGLHEIMFRAKDQNNFWSETYARAFAKASGGTSPNLVRSEYFIDTDPGFGLATQINYTPDSLIDDSVSVNLTGYAQGSHVVMMRSQDQFGSWSETTSRMFINNGATLPPITKLEYFIDADPGFGHATVMNLTPNILQQQNISLDVSSVPSGLHNIHIRAQDSLNNWSETYSRLVQINQSAQTPNINALRYTFDTAAVIGAGNSTAIGPDTLFDGNANLNVAGLSYGFHKLYYYAQDDINHFSLMNLDSVCVGPQARFAADTVCFGNVTTLSDSTIGGDTATVYKWDIDNNGSIDYTTVGSITHQFTTAGTHAVKLIVYNNIACADTFLMQVLVNALPTVSISSSATNICVGGSATLTASGANTYLWSTSQSANPIVVSPAADSSYTVIGTNNAGCTDTANYTIIVDLLPSSSFTASTVCLATATAFSNASINAVNYFWDFGDGTTSTLVNPTHTYAVAGNYNVTLIVSTVAGCADTSISAINVLTLPNVAATPSVNTICAGSNQQVTLAATGAVSYTWNVGGSTASIVVTPTSTTTYTVTGIGTNGCTSAANVTVNVNTIQSLFLGSVYFMNNSTPINVTSGKVFMYNADSVGITIATDSANILANGTFNMGGVPFGNYKIFIEPNKTLFPFLTNTYYDYAYTWDSASVFSFNCADTVNLSIQLDSITNALSGNLLIGGTIRADQSYTGKTMVQGDPIPGVDVALEQHPGSIMLAATTTDANGHYQFNNIPATPAGYTYIIYANIPGFGLDSTYIIHVTGSQTHYDYFVSDSTIYIDSALSAIYNSVKHIDKVNEATDFNVYPNPYKNNTNISFEIKEKSLVQLEIYNALGEKVTVLENTTKDAGTYKYTFSAKAFDYSSGIYFAKLRINNSLSVARLIEIE